MLCVVVICLRESEDVLFRVLLLLLCVYCVFRYMLLWCCFVVIRADLIDFVIVVVNLRIAICVRCCVCCALDVVVV